MSKNKTDAVKPNEKTLGNRTFNMFSYIMLTTICLVCIYPLFYAITGSLKSNMDFITGRGGILPSTPQFDNFARAWSKANFAQYTLNSVIITVIAIIGSVVITAMVGYVFARGEFPGKGIVIGLFLGSMFLSTGAITLFPKYMIARSLNIHGTILGLIVIYVFTINVSSVYLVSGYIKGLPKELDEAARIDGCGFSSTFWRIILPLCKPILATSALLTFKFVWNDYMLPMVFTLSNEDIKTLTVGVVSLKSTGGGAGAYDMMLAGTVIALVPMITFYTFTSKFFISGVTAGAVKG